jgi:hypothetical protein
MATAHPTVLARIATLAEDAAAADAVVEQWVRRFVGVADRQLRRTVLRNCLEEADDGTLLGALPRIDRRAESGDARFRWLATELALTPSVILELPYDRLIDLYEAAVLSGNSRLARRFLHDRPREDSPDPSSNPALDRSPGVRTALARSRERTTIDRLTRDRDPRVIRVLLDNPVLLERDVIHIAAMRPTPPAILQILAEHPRWSSRYAVRKALAFNPYTPGRLARQILPTLLRQDLEEMCGSHVLTEDLRIEVRAFLDARRSS